MTHSRPSLLAITMLPNPSAKQAAKSANARDNTPPIPPHPSIVQRRMELLTSDMLSRALTLVSRGQHERAHHLLNETRTILKGLAKGGLPPIPATVKIPSASNSISNGTGMPNSGNGPLSSTAQKLIPENGTPMNGTNGSSVASPQQQLPDRASSPTQSENSASTFSPASGIDAAALNALDSELEASLEWINHPAVFGRDSRKAVLQAIGVISSQRGYTFRTASESLWAGRVGGVRRLTGLSREWREVGEGEALMEES